MKEAEK